MCSPFSWRNRLHPKGFSLTVDDPEVFTVSGYLPAQQPDDPIIPQAPKRTNLLLVTGQSHDFDPGTSGSVWIGGGGVVDAIQIAGFSSDFARGIGQSMDQYAASATAQVATPVQLVAVF